LVNGKWEFPAFPGLPIDAAGQPIRPEYVGGEWIFTQTSLIFPTFIKGNWIFPVFSKDLNFPKNAQGQLVYPEMIQGKWTFPEFSGCPAYPNGPAVQPVYLDGRWQFPGFEINFPTLENGKWIYSGFSGNTFRSGIEFYDGQWVITNLYDYWHPVHWSDFLWWWRDRPSWTNVPSSLTDLYSSPSLPSFWNERIQIGQTSENQLPPVSNPNESTTQLPPAVGNSFTAPLTEFPADNQIPPLTTFPSAPSPQPPISLPQNLPAPPLPSGSFHLTPDVLPPLAPIQSIKSVNNGFQTLSTLGANNAF